jgi:hypothetical protein
MSGEMFKPCITVSSPVFTKTVVDFGSLTMAKPRKKRAAPTPPAKTTTDSEFNCAFTTIERTAW